MLASSVATPRAAVTRRTASPEFKTGQYPDFGVAGTGTRGWRVGAPLSVRRQPDGTLVLVTRLSTSSQAHLYASIVAGRTAILKRTSRFAVPLGGGTTRTVQVLVLNAGGFPVRLHFTGKGLAHRALVRILVTAVDPWGRRGVFTVSFLAP